ncbi:MAG: glutaredoxin family protein [Spirochaetota bacterium]
MSDAISKVDFHDVPGEREPHKLTVYALSTCAFCRRAMSFLEENGLSYRYVYLDQLDFDLKREVKQELKSKFENLPVFPVLVIDDEEAMSGFTQEKWSERLGLS